MNARTAPAWTALLVAALTGASAQAQAQAQAPAPVDAPRAFSVDDAIDLVRVSAPKLSPDASRVLFLKSELDWDENERETRIWIVGAQGADARPFTGSSDDRDPEWSPDGRWVSFTRPVGGDGDRVRQIFVLPTDGGEAVQLTRHPTAVERHRWTDDARSILFVADDSLAADVEKERENGDDAILIDEGPNGQTRGSWNAVWQVALEVAGEPVDAMRLTPARRRVGDFAPSPDGNFLAYAYRTENRRNAAHLSEIALRAIASGVEERITDNDAPETSVAWSPDGRAITFVAPSLETWELDQGNLYRYDVPSGRVRQLFGDADLDLRSYEWAPGGRALHLVALDRTVANVYRLDARSGDLEPLTREAGVVSGASFAGDHGAAALVLSSPSAPGDVWLADLEDGRMTRLTDANPELASIELARAETVRWTSSDGLEIEGILYRPPGRSRAGAAVLEIHGGPAGAFTRGFDADAQILAAQGYAVLQPNVRGSTGYGDALLRGNMNDIGGGDYEDLVTGVDWMIAQGVAHPDSVAVKGWSYGGILGGWAITRTDRFKAASLGAMVADWRSEFGAGFNFDVTRWYLGGDPWSNAEAWTERSAYSHLDRVTTPTILFHGANDRTDTMEQSMNYFAGLRRFGVDARFVLFPREGHGIREPRHRRTLLIEELRWLHRHVRGMVDWKPPERPTDGSEGGVAPVS